MPDLAPVADGPRQAGEVVEQVVAPALLELLRQRFAPRQIANGVNVRLIGEDARHALAELASDLALVSSMGYLQELLRHPRREQIHVTPVAIPRRVLRPHFGGYEVAPRWQGLPGLNLRRDILGCAAFESIDPHQITGPFRRR